MKCPIDDTELVMTERQGIEIDYCPKCRGVWSDRGELNKVIERPRLRRRKSTVWPRRRTTDISLTMSRGTESAHRCSAKFSTFDSRSTNRPRIERKRRRILRTSNACLRALDQAGCFCSVGSGGRESQASRDVSSGSAERWTVSRASCPATREAAQAARPRRVDRRLRIAILTASTYKIPARLEVSTDERT